MKHQDAKGEWHYILRHEACLNKMHITISLLRTTISESLGCGSGTCVFQRPSR